MAIITEPPQTVNASKQRIRRLSHQYRDGKGETNSHVCLKRLERSHRIIIAILLANQYGCLRLQSFHSHLLLRPDIDLDDATLEVRTVQGGDGLVNLLGRAEGGEAGAALADGHELALARLLPH